MTKKELSLSALKKAVKSLDLATQAKPANDLERDGVIQRFEFTFELAWKTLRRYLELTAAMQDYNIKDIFRAAGKFGLIDSVETWFEYLKARNLTSHTDNEATAKETYQHACLFSKDVQVLVSRLEKKIE